MLILAITPTKCRRCRTVKVYKFFAGMAKLVDALDLGSSGETHKSSNLCMPTINKKDLIYGKF